MFPRKRLLVIVQLHDCEAMAPPYPSLPENALPLTASRPLRHSTPPPHAMNRHKSIINISMLIPFSITSPPIVGGGAFSNR